MPDAVAALEDQKSHFHKNLLREGRSFHFLRAALVGFVAGGMAIVFQMAVHFAETLRHWLTLHLAGYGSIKYLGTILLFAAVTGLAGFLTEKYCPESTGSGIPHVKAVLLNVRRFRWLRIIIVKIAAGFLAIFSGLSLGREGPTIHVGAATGRGIAEGLNIPKRSYRTLIAAGAGAGLSAAFNAPLAGFLFVLEELQRELTPTTYGTALIASVCADAVTRLVMGQHTAFHITGYDTPGMGLLPWIILLGVFGGLVGVLFNKMLMKGSAMMSRFGWGKAVAVGALSGILIWILPEIMGGGHGTAELVLSGSFEKSGLWWMLVVLIFAKLIFTVISYGAAVPGGIFAPILVIGAFTGLFLGEVFHHIMPDAAINSAAFAVLGMAAVFSASVKAPLTGIVLIVEMTGNYEQLYALISASLAAYLIAEAFRSEAIYEALLERDLHKPDPAAINVEEPTLLEVYVEKGSYLADRQVGAVDLPAGVILISLLRGPKEMVPPTHMHIRAGDVAVFLQEDNNARLQYLVSTLGKA